MSHPEFNRGQNVQVVKPHNHIAADDTVYQIGSLDRIQGSITVVLLKDGKAAGAIPQSKLQAAK